MEHELNTGNRTVTFNDQTGVLWIPSDAADSSAYLSAEETNALLIWLHDNHRDALYRMSRGVMPASDNPLCWYCRQPGTYTVREKQTELTLEYNSYKCPNGHIFDVKRTQ